MLKGYLLLQCDFCGNKYTYKSSLYHHQKTCSGKLNGNSAQQDHVSIDDSRLSLLEEINLANAKDENWIPNTRCGIELLH